MPHATGIIDANTPQEAYDAVKEDGNTGGDLVLGIQYVLSEDERTIYFHPKIGWLPEPLVKYDRPKAS